MLGTAQADSSSADYLPLRRDVTAIYDYRNVTTDLSTGEPRKIVTTGTMRATPDGTIRRGGTEYLKWTWRYTGLDGVPDFTILRRRDETGVYSARESNGSSDFTEVLELPASPRPRQSWDYVDAIPSRRRIEGLEVVQTPAGRFESCLRVRRDFSGDIKANTYEAVDHYCPGIGLAKSTFRQRMGTADSITEQTLREITSSADLEPRAQMTPASTSPVPEKQ